MKNSSTILAIAVFYLQIFSCSEAADTNCIILTAAKDRACLEDRNRLCAGKTGRELKNCLSDSIAASASFSDPCIAAQGRRCQVDILAGLSEACREDAQTLCQNVLAISQNNSVPSGISETQKGLRTCLAQQLDKLANENCKKEIKAEAAKRKLALKPYQPAPAAAATTTKTNTGTTNSGVKKTPQGP